MSLEAEVAVEPGPAPSVRAGTLSFAIMQALRVVAAFGVAALVARQLGPAGKGALALVQQVPSIMALIMGFGFAGVNVYYVGSRRKTASEALSDSMLITVVALLVGVPLSFAVMRALPALSVFPSRLLWLSALIVPVSILGSQLAGILVGQGRPAAQASAQSLALLANLAAVGLLYWMVRLSVLAVVAVTLAASALAAVMMLLSVKARLEWPGVLRRMRDAASYARKRYLTEIAAMLEMRVDIVMLGVLSTVAATGVYSVAVALVELLWFIPRAAETPLLSRFFHERAEEGAELVATSVRLTVLLEVFLLGAAALLLRPAVAFVFGPAFTGAPLLFWILAPGVVLNGLVGPIVSYLTSRGHQFPVLSAFSVFGNIALNLALIPPMGVAGAALASSVTYASGSLWLVWRFRRETGCSPVALIVPRREDLRAVFGSRLR
ncbi:MAG: polysaccharide biosynthesis C-terminal domain-containing protein [Coriobacteriia bacterium]|nr:polysaccharide biosynthesis C-terminal domain-containing protein [Coriobacteriia bacterium]